MNEIAKVKAQIAEATDALAGLAVNKSAFDAKLAEITELEETLKRLEDAQKRSASLARPGILTDASKTKRVNLEGFLAKQYKPGSFESHLKSARLQAGITELDTEKDFETYGEQLVAVANYYRSQGTVKDHRLKEMTPEEKMVRSPLGQTTLDPTLGGFAVQTDFETAMQMRIQEVGMLWKNTTQFQISANANGTSIPAVDETSRANGSRFGGIAVYMVNEGDTITASTVKTKRIKLELDKMAGAFYVTEEMLQDGGNQIVQLCNTALAQEFAFKEDDLLIRGNGVGAIGILNAPCKIAVAKESGQAASTILYENVQKMYNRMDPALRSGAEWYVNNDCLPALQNMVLVIGTAGVPVFLPAGQASGKPYDTLFGRPVNVIEQCATLGTEGDIIFANWSQFITAKKGGVRAASSMHVQFLTDQWVYKFTTRLAGQPWWTSAITPANGTTTVSPFITLAAR